MSQNLVSNILIFAAALIVRQAASKIHTTPLKVKLFDTTLLLDMIEIC